MRSLIAYCSGMDESPVTTRRCLPQDPDCVWDRLTSPDGFERWMGAGSTIDARPGGRLTAADVESHDPKTGQVLEVDPGERLLWAWRSLGSLDEVSEVEIELRPGGAGHPEGTEVVVTERPSTVAVPWSTEGAQACVAGGLTAR